MKLSWFNTSMGTQTIPRCMRYEQYKTMQDIREIEFRDSGSNTNTKIYFDVRAIALRPRLHIEGFLLCPYKEPPPRNLHVQSQEYTTSLSNTTTSAKEAKHKVKTTITYTRGIKAQSQTPPQSPLHKRDNYKAKAQPPLHQRDRHKNKAKER